MTAMPIDGGFGQAESPCDLWEGEVSSEQLVDAAIFDLVLMTRRRGVACSMQ